MAHARTPSRPAHPQPFEPYFTCLVPSCERYQVPQYCMPLEVWDPKAADGKGALVPNEKWSHALWSVQSAALWHWARAHELQTYAERGQDVPQEYAGVQVGAGIQPMFSYVTEASGAKAQD